MRPPSVPGTRASEGANEVPPELDELLEPDELLELDAAAEVVPEPEMTPLLELELVPELEAEDDEVALELDEDDVVTPGHTQLPEGASQASEAARQAELSVVQRTALLQT